MFELKENEIQRRFRAHLHLPAPFSPFWGETGRKGKIERKQLDVGPKEIGHHGHHVVYNLAYETSARLAANEQTAAHTDQAIEKICQHLAEHPRKLATSTLERGYHGEGRRGFWDSDNTIRDWLSPASLTAALLSFAQQKGEDGKPLQAKASALLVPLTLEREARYAMGKLEAMTQIPVEVTPHLLGRASWYLIDANQAVKPVVVHTETAAELRIVPEKVEQNPNRNGTPPPLETGAAWLIGRIYGHAICTLPHLAMRSVAKGD